MPVSCHVLVAPAYVEAVLCVGAGCGQILLALKDMLVVDLIELVQLLLIEHVRHDDVALSCERGAHRVVHFLISLRIGTTKAISCVWMASNKEFSARVVKGFKNWPRI